MTLLWLALLELIRFEKHGHFVHWEEPEGFASALRAFLDDANVPPVRLKPQPAPRVAARDVPAGHPRRQARRTAR
jgi:hypothetical protein